MYFNITLKVISYFAVYRVVKWSPHPHNIAVAELFDIHEKNVHCALFVHVLFENNS